MDISARGFWHTSHEQAFVNVRVFNPLAKSHLNQLQILPSCYHKNENEKKRTYDEHIRNVEHGIFLLWFFQLLVRPESKICPKISPIMLLSVRIMLALCS